MKIEQNVPIVLTGRVFVDKLLAAEHPQYSLRSTVRTGDLKLIAVQNLAKPKSKSSRAPARPFAGFFAGYVFDGTQWRKFHIRAAAAAEATYTSDGHRREQILACVKVLAALKGATAIWRNHAFEVHNPVTFGRSQKAAQSASQSPTGEARGIAAPAANPKDANPQSKLVQGTLFD